MDDAQQPEQPPRHYVNYVSSLAGGIDFTLDFGLHLPDDTLTHVVGVTMTWEEVKIVHRILTTAIADYEHQIGPIRDLELGNLAQGDQGGSED